MRVRIQREPASEMHRDLGIKFVTDLSALVIRALDVMHSGGIDPYESADIMITSLLLTALEIEEGVEEPGLVMAQLRAGILEKKRRKGKG